MTTGSLVVLLEGGPPASLGTASPTSCNEGSRYIATGRWGREKRGREGEDRGRRGEGDTAVVRKDKKKRDIRNWGESVRIV